MGFPHHAAAGPVVSASADNGPAGAPGRIWRRALPPDSRGPVTGAETSGGSTHQSKQRLRQLVQNGPASEILVFVTSCTPTNLLTGYVMTANSNAVQSVDLQPDLNKVPPSSPASVIDFFEARHRLLAESEEIAKEFEIKPELQETVIRRDRSVGLFDAFEEAFYWLISATVLAYLTLGIFGV